MNKVRRNELQKALDHLSEAKELLENVRNEEQDAFDNLPEGLQNADKGQAMEQAVQYLDEAIGQLEDVESTINDASA